MTNEAAIGYMILAARSADLDFEMIQVLEAKMKRSMDERTGEEAEEAYREHR